jgi:hypothetical protein
VEQRDITAGLSFFTSSMCTHDIQRPNFHVTHHASSERIPNYDEELLPMSPTLRTTFLATHWHSHTLPYTRLHYTIL